MRLNNPIIITTDHEEMILLFGGIIRREHRVDLAGFPSEFVSPEGHALGHTMVHAGRLPPLRHSRSAEIAELRGDRDVFDDHLAVRVIRALHDANPPLVDLEIVLLLTGEFTSMDDVIEFLVKAYKKRRS